MFAAAVGGFVAAGVFAWQGMPGDAASALVVVCSPYWSARCASAGWRGGQARGRRQAVNDYAVLAFVVAPGLALALGWGAVFLHEHISRRDRQPR